MRNHEPPVSAAELARELRARWRIEATSVRHEAIGAGGYHWTAAEPSGRRWFVTASDLDALFRPPGGAAAAFADLQATMETASILATAGGLGFVLPPVRTADGRTASRLGTRLALTVHPFMDAERGGFDGTTDASERAAITDLLTELHQATGAVPGAPIRPLAVRGRQAVDAALASQAGSLSSAGPFATPARAILAAQAGLLRQAWRMFDDLVARVSAVSGPAVLTHGEPHAGNILRAGSRRWLVDWDTAGLAWPERDLWMVAGPDGAEAARYTAATGRPVLTEALALYRLRWALDDLTIFAQQLLAPHDRTPAIEDVWTWLTATISALADQVGD